MWSVVHLPLRLHQHGQVDVVLRRPTPGTARAAAAGPSRARRRPRWPSRRRAGRRSRSRRGRSRAPGRSRRPAGRGARRRLVVTVGERVEVERAGERVGDHRVGRRDERLRVGVAVVALREVAVVAVDDRVDLRRVEVGAVPLADARPAGVGEHGRADRLEVGEQAVALDRGPHLLGARRDEQLRLGPESLRGRLAGDRRGPGDVLVRRVGARADRAPTRPRSARRCRVPDAPTSLDLVRAGRACRGR